MQRTHMHEQKPLNKSLNFDKPKENFKRKSEFSKYASPTTQSTTYTLQLKLNIPKNDYQRS